LTSFHASVRVFAASICYEDYISLTDTVISGCQCDPTCNTCGFDSWPSDPEDCIDCKFPLTQLAKDPNTMLGACTPAGLCYESPNSDPIEGCTCDPTCGSCGYSENPTGPNNCITCMYWTYGQLIINQTTKNADGTGECVPPMYCYLDQDHRRARSPIPNCECHHNCLVRHRKQTHNVPTRMYRRASNIAYGIFMGSQNQIKPAS